MSASDRGARSASRTHSPWSSLKVTLDLLLAQLMLWRMTGSVAGPTAEHAWPEATPREAGRTVLDPDGAREARWSPEPATPALAGVAARPLFLMVKRAVDICGALSCLVVVLPVVLVIGLLIKLDSPGPVFYRSERVGRGGRPISVLKFRSMYIDSDRRLAELRASEWHRDEFQARFKIREDPRRTRVGRVLRRTSLDEIPQFWNALRGDMSLVGPRPVVEEELSLYRQVDGGLAAYLAVRPGLTGLWQVGGRSETTYEERVRLDMRYVADMGILTDARILLKTPIVVIRGSGAY